MKEELTHILNATLGDGTKIQVSVVAEEHFPPGFYICRRLDTEQIIRVHRDNLKMVEQKEKK